MDTSETYIKMCDCPEIQGRIWETGDVYAFAGESGYVVSSDYAPQHSIWLPRQDQLQEMVSTCFKAGLDLEILYAWYQRNRPHDVADEWDSMEQLWLAFVMKEKYGKVWTGSEWYIPKGYHDVAEFYKEEPVNG